MISLSRPGSLNLNEHAFYVDTWKGFQLVDYQTMIGLVRIPTLRFWIDCGVVQVIGNTEEFPCSCCFPSRLSA